MFMLIEPGIGNKRFKAVFKDKDHKIVFVTQFGAKNGQTYIDHHDKTKRENYIKRHKALGEEWNKINAGSLSRWILWGDSTNLISNIASYKKKFNLS